MYPVHSILSGWRRAPLAIKLTLSIAIVVVTAVAIITSVSIDRERQNFRRELEDQARLVLIALSEGTSDAVYFLEVQKLSNLAKRLVTPSPVLQQVIFYDAKGRPIAKNEVSAVLDFEVDPLGQQLITSGTVVFAWQSDQLLAGQAIEVEQQRLGAVSVALTTSQLTKKIMAVRNQGLLAALLTIAASTLVVLLISRTITEPIAELNNAAGALAGGEWVQTAAAAREDEVGQLARAFNSMATDLQSAFVTLEESRSRLQRVIEQAADAIMLIDENGRFQVVNKQACHNLGYERSEFLDLSLFDIETTVNHEEGLRFIQALPIGLSQTSEGVHRRKDGSTFPVEVRLGKLDTGELLAIVRDVSERKQNEAERDRMIAELEAKNAELERFTYTVSHDLKSPLVTIQGFLGMLQKDVRASNLDRIEKDMSFIREAAAQMDILLDDLLQLSRIGRLINPPEHVPFRELAEEAIARVAGQIQATGALINLQADLPTVYGDRLRLIEVLQNLVDNGIKFMDDQPEPVLEIGYYQNNGEYVFFVRDNGRGIDVEYHERIFGLFDRLDPSVAGTGIGLALVKRIIEVHNGRIWVESGGAGQGSTFFFTLPVVR